MFSIWRVDCIVFTTGRYYSVENLFRPILILEIAGNFLLTMITIHNLNNINRTLLDLLLCQKCLLEIFQNVTLFNLGNIRLLYGPFPLTLCRILSTTRISLMFADCLILLEICILGWVYFYFIAYVQLQFNTYFIFQRHFYMNVWKNVGKLHDELVWLLLKIVNASLTLCIALVSISITVTKKSDHRSAIISS